MRRRQIVKSALQGTAALLFIREALAQGRVEKGVYRIRGNAHVNGASAQQGGELRPGDTVRTQPGGEIVFAVQSDAFLVRQNSEVSIVANGLRVVTGAVLSVFRPNQRKEIRTATAVIGIRGTAVYIEAEAERTYACTCYGTAVLTPIAQPSAAETVTTRHHEAPRYIMASGAPQMVMPAPVINHTDAELILLEGIVGRQPPFIGQGFRPFN
ncbi:MAG TPA: hypothetical protein VF110_16400 [Burkholderiales bacterium]